MSFIARLIINALALMLIAYLVPGVSIIHFGYAVLAAFVLGLVNALIRPIMLLLTLPINILTLGLFTLVVNALMFWLAASLTVGFAVTGFGAAFWGGLIFSAVSWVMSSMAKQQ